MSQKKRVRIYKDGGEKPPRYTDDPNDPGIQAYADSLYVHKRGEELSKHLAERKIKSYTGVPHRFEGEPYAMDLGRFSAEQARKLAAEKNINHKFGAFTGDKVPRNAPRVIRDYNPPDEDQEFSTREWYGGSNWDKDFIDTEEKAPIKPINYAVYRDFAYGTRLGFSSDGNNTEDDYKKLSDNYSIAAHYKKPVQPVIYRDPEIVAKQQQLIDAGYDIGEVDGVWGEKSQVAWEEMQNKVDKLPIRETNILLDVERSLKVNVPKQNLHREYNPFTKQYEQMSPEQHRALEREAYKLQSRGEKLDASNMPSYTPRTLDAVSRRDAPDRTAFYESLSKAHREGLSASLYNMFKRQ